MVLLGPSQLHHRVTPPLYSPAELKNAAPANGAMRDDSPIPQGWTGKQDFLNSVAVAVLTGTPRCSEGVCIRRSKFGV